MSAEIKLVRESGGLWVVKGAISRVGRRGAGERRVRVTRWLYDHCIHFEERDCDIIAALSKKG